MQDGRRAMWRPRRRLTPLYRAEFRLTAGVTESVRERQGCGEDLRTPAALVDDVRAGAARHGRGKDIGLDAKIGTLVVVTGIQASGKTWFSRRFLDGRWPSLCSALGLSLEERWVNAERLAAARLDLRGAGSPNLLLEYGLLRLARDSWRDQLPFRLAAEAERTVILTLWCEPPALLRRVCVKLLQVPYKGPLKLAAHLLGIKSRRRKGVTRLTSDRTLCQRACHFLKHSVCMHLAMAVLYKQLPNVVCEVYGDWVRRAGSLTDIEHWIVDVTDAPPLLVKPAEWLTTVREFPPGM